MTPSRVSSTLPSGREPGPIIDNKTFAQSPHKTFFTEETPDHLKDVVDYLARRDAEARLEQCRLEQFPEKPSRSEAIFLNPTLETAVTQHRFGIGWWPTLIDPKEEWW
jgi:hypothetical protein